MINAITCQVCKQRVPVRKDGTVVTHLQKPNRILKTPPQCQGSNRLVAAEGDRE